MTHIMNLVKCYLNSLCYHIQFFFFEIFKFMTIIFLCIFLDIKLLFQPVDRIEPGRTDLTLSMVAVRS